MKRMIRECLLLIGGIIFGFHITTFWQQHRCPFTLKRNGRPRTMTKRPRTITKQVQLEKRNVIFVGVMTTEQFLQTRAQAVFDTWGKNVAGKLTFFTSDVATLKTFDLPVVSLAGVDDSYPPLKKSFMTMKYMHDHHIDDFEWFMRADDDVYVRNDKLVSLLRSLNSSDDIYLGHAGTGAKKERGKLNLLPGENYCIGGPGMVFSRSVLKKVAPHIEHCLQTAPKSYMHEDIEVGRCIQRFVGVLCTTSYEMNTLFFHQYTGNGTIFHNDLNRKIINNAITLHPVKEPAYMYRLHSHFMSERIQDLQYKAVTLNRVLRNMDRMLQSKDKRLYLQNKLNLQDGKDFYHQLPINNIEKWDMFTVNTLYSDTIKNPPLIALRGALEIEVNSSLEKSKELLNKEIRKTRNLMNLVIQKVNYGYRRVHPLYGVQHVIDVTIKSKKRTHNNTSGETKTAYSSYGKRFYTQQPFGNLIYSSETLNNTPRYVHFLVPLEGRLETFRRFMENFELVCLKQLQRVKLVVVYSSTVSSPLHHKAIMKEYQDKYPEAELMWLNVEGNFSRGISLTLAADKFDQTALLFLCDVDLVFNLEFIDRCRMNTAIGKQVYFPIMFSQFDTKVTYPNKTKPDSSFAISKNAGIWRSYSYGPACMYHHDFDAVGGFDTSIKGWGLEDVDLFEKFVHHPGIEVFRAADPGLIHVYHPVKCDPHLVSRQLAHCRGSKASGLASQKSLITALLSMNVTQHNSSF